jgi:hypothetical protein
MTPHHPDSRLALYIVIIPRDSPQSGLGCSVGIPKFQTTTRRLKLIDSRYPSLPNGMIKLVHASTEWRISRRVVDNDSSSHPQRRLTIKAEIRDSINMSLRASDLSASSSLGQLDQLLLCCFTHDRVPG